LEVTGRAVIIDTSSEVSDAALLSRHPDVDFHVVHLVRDPLGVANSHRRAARNSGQRFSAANAIYLGCGWMAFNSAAELLRRGLDLTRYRRERYEDLVSAPITTLDSVLSLVGRTTPLDLVTDGTAQLEVTHSAAGNPRRFATGAVVLREDRSWESELPGLDRWLVRVLSAPLARAYAYR
jgi:hypothetical protein